MHLLRGRHHTHQRRVEGPPRAYPARSSRTRRSEGERPPPQAPPEPPDAAGSGLRAAGRPPTSPGPPQEPPEPPRATVVTPTASGGIDADLSEGGSGGKPRSPPHQRSPALGAVEHRGHLVADHPARRQPLDRAAVRAGGVVFPLFQRAERGRRNRCSRPARTLGVRLTSPGPGGNPPAPTPSTPTIRPTVAHRGSPIGRTS